MSVEISGFAVEQRADIEGVVEHLEENHADTLLFVASQARVDQRDRFVEAVVTGIDPAGITFRLVGDGVTSDARLTFGAEAATMGDLQGQFFALVATARELMPDHPVTSIESEIEHAGTLRIHVGTVLRSERIAPNFVEVTLGGFAGLPALGGDEFHYLMVPEQPDLIADGALLSELDALPDGSFVGASYTTRRRRLDAGEIDMWILLHGHDNGVSGWAADARPGLTVALWGPRRGYDPPAETSHHLLVCDETGLPAACAIVESLPADHGIILIAEVIDTEHGVPLPDHPGLAARWIERGDTEPGTAGLLLEAVRELAVDGHGWYAFGAAESREISAIRRHLRQERAWAPEQVHMTGYWRRGGW